MSQDRDRSPLLYCHSLSKSPHSVHHLLTTPRKLHNFTFQVLALCLCSLLSQCPSGQRPARVHHDRHCYWQCCRLALPSPPSHCAYPSPPPHSSYTLVARSPFCV